MVRQLEDLHPTGDQPIANLRTACPLRQERAFSLSVSFVVR